MPDPYSETTDWQGTAWAFAIWAAHFSISWGASSVFPDREPARWVALGATVIAMGALAMVWRSRMPSENRVGERRILMLAEGVAALSVVFGALPALIG